jgi:hypothetical protein
MNGVNKAQRNETMTDYNRNPHGIGGVRFGGGQPSNAGGRPKSLIVLQLEARKHVLDAIATLAKIIKGEVDPNRVPAIREMLDLRGVRTRRRAWPRGCNVLRTTTQR